MLGRPLYLMRGKTSHTRFLPKRHHFRYGVTLIDVDVDRLEEANDESSVFSVNKSNLVSIQTDKRGDQGKSMPGEWARSVFSAADINAEGCSIRLITFPETQFYSFSPLSLWLLLDDNHALRGVIYEVNNTFGERHAYVAACSPETTKQIVDKVFHVSPFMDVAGQYEFDIRHTPEEVNLLIRNLQDGECVHSASLSLQRQPATTSDILRFLISSPFAGIGVMIAIHWEATKLFLKGMKYRPKPTVPKHLFTVGKRVFRTSLFTRDEVQ